MLKKKKVSLPFCSYWEVTLRDNLSRFNHPKHLLTQLHTCRFVKTGADIHRDRDLLSFTELHFGTKLEKAQLYANRLLHSASISQARGKTVILISAEMESTKLFTSTLVWEETNSWMLQSPQPFYYSVEKKQQMCYCELTVHHEVTDARGRC